MTMFGDPKLEAYINEHSTQEDELLQELNRQTHLKMLNPRMISGHLQGRFLEMLSRMIKPARILEIGTYTGYSAICLGRGLVPGGVLHTIEINDEIKDFARDFFRRAGLGKSIIQHTGNAIDIIGRLNDSFDLVFIDGDKAEYPDYLTMVRPKLNAGGFLIADNVLWNNKVVNKANLSDPSTAGIDSFNKKISTDRAMETVILPVRDGLLMARKL